MVFYSDKSLCFSKVVHSVVEIKILGNFLRLPVDFAVLVRGCFFGDVISKHALLFVSWHPVQVAGFVYMYYLFMHLNFVSSIKSVFNGTVPCLARRPQGQLNVRLPVKL